MIPGSTKPHHRFMWLHTLALVATTVFLTATRCEHRKKEQPTSAIVAFAKSLTLDPKSVNADLKEFANSPHPFGSLRQKELAAYLSSRAKSLNLSVFESPFTANTPNPLLLEKPTHPAPARIKREGRNIFAWQDRKDAKCAVLLGSHYDTKEIEGITFVGANDSGSSSALLLQILSSIMAFQKDNKQDCLVIGAWFDGEESTLPEWRDGEWRHPNREPDHTYGSRHEAARLRRCQEKAYCLPPELSGLPLKAVVIIDMLGSPGIAITKDLNSSPALLSLLKKADSALFSKSILSKQAGIPIEDDHIPFRDLGIPVLDIIDFQNIDLWHTAADNLKNLSFESLAKAHKLATAIALSLADES